MSKSIEILQALTAAGEPLRVDQVCEAVGEADEGATKRVGALLTYQRSQGRCERLGSTQTAHWCITADGRQWLADVIAESATAEPKAAPRAAAAQLKTKPAKAPSKAAPALKPAARTPRALAPAQVGNVPALHVDPPGSVALADDGSIVLIESDRVVARISAHQAANVAALVGRYRNRA